MRNSVSGTWNKKHFGFPDFNFFFLNPAWEKLSLLSMRCKFTWKKSKKSSAQKFLERN